LAIAAGEDKAEIPASFLGRAIFTLKNEKEQAPSLDGIVGGGGGKGGERGRRVPLSRGDQLRFVENSAAIGGMQKKRGITENKNENNPKGKEKEKQTHPVRRENH